MTPSGPRPGCHHDPAGAPLEPYVGRALGYEHFASPAGVSGFVTGQFGDMGLGHVVLPAPDIEASRRFWLDGGLAISAVEQVDMLRRLRRDALPFEVAHQRLVKDLILIERGPGFVLYGKTGWTFDAEPQLGWFIGWVDTADGAVFFALNIDMPGGAADAPKREAIVRKALVSIGALPAV